MIRRLLTFGTLSAAVAVSSLAGCKSSNEPQTVSLNGAGSTFANPLYSAWGSEYAKLHPGVEINYQSIGSGGGIRQVIAGTVDFGGTDGPMTDQQLAEAKSKLGTDILHFPVALGADVPVYNVPRRHHGSQLHSGSPCGHLLGKDHQVERPRDRQIQPWGQSACKPNCCMPSL